MLQIILLHILRQVINLHLKTKTSEHSEWPVLRANAWVGVVKAYGITMGTQPKSQLAHGAGTRQAPSTAVLLDRFTLSDKTGTATPYAAKHSSMGTPGAAMPQPASLSGPNNVPSPFL